MYIGNDVVVGISYTITNQAGEIVDASPEHTPWYFLHGAKECPLGLEKALLGRGVGASVQVCLPPELAYGLRNEEAIIIVPRSELPATPPPQIGMVLTVCEGPNETDFRVISVNESEVKLDANHPLAGQTLNFEASVTEVRPAYSSELLSRSATQPGNTSA